MADTAMLVVKVLASISALYMCLSPSTSLYRIHKQQTTGLMSVLPLMALLFFSHLWLLYGYVTDDMFPIVTTYVIGDLTSLGFIAVYYRWSTQRRYVLKVFVFVLTFCGLFTVYAVLGMKGLTGQRQNDVKLLVGFAANASSILLYASPLATVMLVLRTKSSASIPFEMVLVGLVNNVLWVLYGVLLEDPLVYAPSCVSFVSCSVQFVLYFVFRDKSVVEDKLTRQSVVVGASDHVEVHIDNEMYTQVRSPKT